MNENEVDEGIIWERQKRHFLARKTAAQRCPRYERMIRKGHCELDDTEHT
jgi:hypothetical protein